MALKPCRECGKEISTEASICPQCGAPEPTAKNPSKFTGSQKVLGWAALVAGLVATYAARSAELSLGGFAVTFFILWFIFFGAGIKATAELNVADWRRPNR